MSSVSQWRVALVLFGLLAAPAPAGAESASPDFSVKLDAGVPTDLGVMIEGGATDLPVTPDKGATFDGPIVLDGGLPTTCAQAIGKACTSSGGQCGAMGTCLLTTSTSGVCTCGCVRDNPATPLVNEDTCPDLSKNLCGQLQLSDGSTQNSCFRKCQPKLGANECQAPLVCSPRAGATIGIRDATICLFDGCTNNSDCPVTTGVACTVGGSCGPGETCIALTTGSTQGMCAKDGLCDLKSGLCDKHSTAKPGAKVGDPCQGDTDCGQYMSCQIQTDLKALGAKDHGASCTDDNDCCSRNCESSFCKGACAVHARNGYCMVSGCALATAFAFSEFACPAGSDCNIIYSGGLCQKTCQVSVASDCRANTGDRFGDYDCRAWNNLSVGGVPISKSAVCDFGDAIRCSFFGTSTLDCSNLGQQPGNATNMSCRSMDNTKLTNPKDPKGWCLDDTASGPSGTPAIDAGVDAVPVDAELLYDWVPQGDTEPAVDAKAVTPPDEEQGGCSCSTTRGASGGWVMLLALGLLALARRRR